MVLFFMCKIVVPENIHTRPTEGLLFCTPLPPGNSSLASYFASKILASKNPLPLRISDDLPWGGYGFFLELYILKFMDVAETCEEKKKTQA